MGDTLFYTEIIIVAVTTLVLLFFSIRQSHQRQLVKDMPLCLGEWKT